MNFHDKGLWMQYFHHQSTLFGEEADGPDESSRKPLKPENQK